MKTALITNPHARRNRKGGDKKLVAEADKLGMAVYRIEDFTRLPELVEQMMVQSPQLVVISGGDGAVHAVLSLLAERTGEDNQPLLALLPHGTTNVTSLQLSQRKPDPKQLTRICALAEAGVPAQHLSHCRTVRIANLLGQPPLHGFINASGVVASATRRCQTNLNQNGWTGNVAVALSLIADLTKKIFSRDPEAGGLLKSVPMELKTMEGVIHDGGTLSVLISTLDRLVLGSCPFWNIGEAPLRVARVAENPPAFFTNLYRILFGNKDKLPPSHFQGFTTNALTLKVDGEILIDGEFYSASAQTPLEISAGPEFRFVKL